VVALGSTLGAGCDGAADFNLPSSALSLNKTDAAAKSPLQDSATDLPNGAAVEQALIAAVNAERAKYHLRPLRPDPTLDQIADFYACRMIEGGFFSHEDPFDGSTVDVRAANFGYAFRKVGENLAAGHDTVEEVVAHWMRSPGHRANILDPAFMDIGVSVKVGGEYHIYWVEEFGRPLTAPSESSEAKSDEAGSSSEKERVSGDSAAAGSATPTTTSDPAEESPRPAVSPASAPASGKHSS
jgi:uncharacterized protein YkwD